MKNEESLSAREHETQVKYVSELFGNLVDNIVAIIGDNCEVNNWMGKLKGKKLDAELRSSGCQLAPQQMNVTRWSSTFNMLKLYVELKAYLHSNFTTETSILDFFLNPREENDIVFLIEIFGESELVRKALQRECIDLAYVRLLFHGVFENLPYIDTSKKISS